ncbi:zinc finger protein ZFP2-like isoform X2 [Eurosta solidaginis]|uniref:zinc finger protein ZFP2-like isoform X2 n=1 Tax=Eurosta solidaginis TaxID=178769 RepID=UPI0035306D1D
MDTSDQDFDCLCRTCLKVEASSYDDNTTQEKLLSILEQIEECGALQIAELISKIVPQIHIQLNDELPKKICYKCMQQLLSAYRFQRMCIQADLRMHELIARKRTETTIKDELLKNDTYSDALISCRPSSTHHNLKEQVIVSEAEQSSDTEHLRSIDQLLEHCEDSHNELSEFIKIEPIEDDEHNTEYSDGATMHLTHTMKDDLLFETDELQINSISSNHNCHPRNKAYKRLNDVKEHLKHHKPNDEHGQVDVQRSPRIHKEESLQNHNLGSDKNVNTKKDPAPFKKENQLSCYICNKSFIYASKLRRHVRTHGGELSSLEQRNLEMQHLNLSEDKPYKCPQCPLRFLHKYGMSRHQQIHVGIKRQPCDICGKIVRKAELRQHKRIHSGEKPHKCDICEKRFTHKSHLNTHLRTHTGEKPFKCKYCGHVFATRTGMLNHLRIHMGDNIYECELCPLAFATASVRRLHSATHIDDDPETRERNMKALIEKETKLKTQQLDMETAEHQIYNGSINGYECDICGKSFRDTSRLTLHELIHRGERPHKCKFCELRFADGCNKRRHMRTHTDERPFECKYCEGTYLSNHGMLRHLPTHLGANVYRCDVCPLALPLSTERRLHLATHKNEDPETRERNLKALREEEAKLKDINL